MAVDAVVVVADGDGLVEDGPGRTGDAEFAPFDADVEHLAVHVDVGVVAVDFLVEAAVVGRN